MQKYVLERSDSKLPIRKVKFSPFVTVEEIPLVSNKKFMSELEKNAREMMSRYRICRSRVDGGYRKSSNVYSRRFEIDRSGVVMMPGADLGDF